MLFKVNKTINYQKQGWYCSYNYDWYYVSVYTHEKKSWKKLL